MTENSTDGFFAFMNRMNDIIVADTAARNISVGGDPVRAERQRARRERLGQLRARPRTGNRPVRARNAFGHVKLNE